MKTYEDNRLPEDIESDIERTRAEVSSTLDAIQNKLTPGQLMDQAVSYARTSLPADFGANLANAVRDNPVPVALIGVGIAWLMASGRNADGGARQRRLAAMSESEMDAEAYSSGAFTEGQAEGGVVHRAASRLGDVGRDVKDKVGGMKDKVSDIGHRISDRASSVTGRARDAGHGARARISAIGERSQQGYYRTRDNLSHLVEEQPLLVGAMGLALGTLLGAMLPRTEREDEMMGNTRDDLLGRAKETLREQAANVKESVQRVMDEQGQQSGDPQQAGRKPSGGDSATASSGAGSSASTAATGAEAGNIDSTRFGGGQSPYGPH